MEDGSREIALSREWFYLQIAIATGLALQGLIASPARAVFNLKGLADALETDTRDYLDRYADAMPKARNRK